MKWILLAVYVGLVALGAIIIAVRSQRKFEFTAARDLPLNHRVAAADLKAPDLSWTFGAEAPRPDGYSGGYLDREVRAGHALPRNTVRTRPVRDRTVETYLWYLRDSEKQWAQIVDPGWIIDLCADSCVSMGMPVLAVECTGTDGASALLLQVTPDQRKAILGFAGKQKLNINVSEANPGGWP